MKKESKSTDPGRQFRLAHQTLCITAFNFERQSLIGYVELLIHPLKPDLKRLKINSKQCRIYRVSINDVWEAAFLYNDPTLEICQGDGKQRNLDYFEGCHINAMTAVDADCGLGEVTIRIPGEALPLIQELKPMRVCIEFSLEEPKGGIKFVVPDTDGTMLDRGAHLFTYGHENSSRLWFPCIDSYSEVCTWKLELTVDMYMTAVSCGDLIETVYTTDLRKKTYHYFLSVPTSAPNIALAVGPFEVLVDPNMHEVTHFCLPHLMPVLKQSTAFMHDIFEFYEEIMACRYPYSCYKLVFVDQAYCDYATYATMTVFSTNILHSKRIIDQVPVTREIMAHAIAQQFFGCFITMHSWCDAWLPKGISAYLASLYKRKAFGNSEYRHHIASVLKRVTHYESSIGGIVLDPEASKENPMYFSTRNPHTIPAEYHKVYEEKALLILRMLEIRIGRELLLQAFNKLQTLAQNAAQLKFTSNTWSNMLLSTASFLRGLSTVTGKDVKTFIEQWVQQSGCAHFHGNFIFNRKRNVVELELKQDMSARGARRYVGPLTVAIQELDGTFNHTFKIEENKTKFEITCHSKSRRNKKKKIPLCTGEEVDMDLSQMDADSPVLWLRVDPDMTLLQRVTLEQPDYMWQYMLKYERDVVAQSQAIMALENYPSPATRLALTDTIENEHIFYRIRTQAANALAKVANLMVSGWAGPPAMMAIFRKMFGAHSCPEVVRQNNFSNFQNYFLQKTIPVAMSSLRNIHGICPPEVVKFLLDLFKYNDNTRNKYSDNYYRAAMIEALANTVSAAVTTVTITGQGPSTDLLTADIKLILEEVTRHLNMEKLLPSYRLTVTVSCLKAVRKLQKFGHIPPDDSIFRSYAAHGVFTDVRIAALEALVDFTKVETSYECLCWLLDLLENDPEPYIRHKLLQLLAENPPFQREDNSGLSTEFTVERLWKYMNSTFFYDSRLRCDVAHLYYTLYGRNRPSCLPIPESVVVLNLKEKTTLINSSMQADAFQSQSSYSGAYDYGGTRDSLKRGAPSPPSHYSQLESSVDPSITAQPADDSQFKLKIKIGKRSDSDEGELLSPKIDVTSLPTSPAKLPASAGLSYAGEFAKFTMQDDVKSETKSQSPLAIGTIKMKSEHSQESMHSFGASHLSEDSNSGDASPINSFADGNSSAAPTSFDSSMFSGPGLAGGILPPVSMNLPNLPPYPPPISSGGVYPPPVSTGGVYLPPVSTGGVYPPPVGSAYLPPASTVYPPPVSGAGYPPPVSGAGYPPLVGGAGYPPPVNVGSYHPVDLTGGSVDLSLSGQPSSATPTPPPQGQEGQHKAHKAKKKKKKNKHKHKHKHKHDKEKEKSGWLERQLHTGGVILDHPPSSEASNSPYVNTPSSPEFEEI